MPKLKIGWIIGEVTNRPTCNTHLRPKLYKLTHLNTERRRRREEEEEMERREQHKKSRVVKVQSEESWDFLTTQANNQGCPVLAHFTAVWCMPSVAMNHFFEELALRYQDILFLAVDVDEVKGVASKMEIKAMPTFLLLREGAMVDRLVGANPDEMRKRISGFLKSIRSHKSTQA
ncbi:thioredoxin-like protein CXXS1 [Malania oleifera]|uniref:thioredoxin-like protein CXXS1 n=1 Tax=Malania oleifera TaxID=397392 RepID=UPI0025ADC76C|nr:thioredoxin-like protein CXXS1 [Malania oleifera]